MYVFVNKFSKWFIATYFSCLIISFLFMYVFVNKSKESWKRVEFGNYTGGQAAVQVKFELLVILRTWVLRVCLGWILIIFLRVKSLTSSSGLLEGT